MEKDLAEQEFSNHKDLRNLMKAAVAEVLADHFGMGLDPDVHRLDHEFLRTLKEEQEMLSLEREFVRSLMDEAAERRARREKRARMWEKAKTQALGAIIVATFVYLTSILGRVGETAITYWRKMNDGG